MRIPANPKIYHIVHGTNLKSIISDGGLHCDATMAHRPAVGTSIGMTNIKERRRGWVVPCYPNTYVGDYVPFYFCPRSVMLHRIYVNQGKDDDLDLSYSGGQAGIIHLEADLKEVVDWARTDGCRWAFSTGNAAAAGSEFYTDLDRLDEIDWEAVQARYWQAVRDSKQAEFLVHGFFPWRLVSRIGTQSAIIGNRVREIIGDAEHKPTVVAIPGWYY